MKTTEEWARSAPAGQDLNYVCCEWVGWDGIHEDDMDFVCPYSTDWCYAGPLLEAMRADIVYEFDGLWHCSVTHDNLVLGKNFPEGADWIVAFSRTPQLAIARACAMLVAHGIKKEDLR